MVRQACLSLSLASRGREASTLAQYRQHARHLTDRIGSYKLASLTTPRVNTLPRRAADDHVGDILPI
jgi:hypothetical protein